jgi:hypothetical protein
VATNTVYGVTRVLNSYISTSTGDACAAGIAKYLNDKGNLTSNMAMWSSNTAVAASNTAVAASNVAYPASNVAAWSSNTAVAASNVAYPASNVAAWSSNTAAAASNTAYTLDLAATSNAAYATLATATAASNTTYAASASLVTLGALAAATAVTATAASAMAISANNTAVAASNVAFAGATSLTSMCNAIFNVTSNAVVSQLPPYLKLTACNLTATGAIMTLYATADNNSNAAGYATLYRVPPTTTTTRGLIQTQSAGSFQVTTSGPSFTVRIVDASFVQLTQGEVTATAPYNYTLRATDAATFYGISNMSVYTSNDSLTIGPSLTTMVYTASNVAVHAAAAASATAIAASNMAYTLDLASTSNSAYATAVTATAASNVAYATSNALYPAVTITGCNVAILGTVGAVTYSNLPVATNTVFGVTRVVNSYISTSTSDACAVGIAKNLNDKANLTSNMAMWSSNTAVAASNTAYTTAATSRYVYGSCAMNFTVPPSYGGLIGARAAGVHVINHDVMVPNMGASYSYQTATGNVTLPFTGVYSITFYVDPGISYNVGDVFSLTPVIMNSSLVVTKYLETNSASIYGVSINYPVDMPRAICVTYQVGANAGDVLSAYVAHSSATSWSVKSFKLSIHLL